MPNDPSDYKWLNDLSPLPRMVEEALKMLGTKEVPGPGNSKVIMQWAKELGDPSVANVYTADSVPWCGLFMAIIAKRAGKTPVKDPLWALNWGAFGVPAGQPGLGDVLTFIRPEGGHVTSVFGDVKAHTHMTLRGQMIDLVGLDPIQELDEVRRIGNVAVVQEQSDIIDVGIAVQPVDPARVECGRSSDNAVDFVALV